MPVGPETLRSSKGRELLYQVAGRTLASNITFPELPLADGPAQLRFSLIRAEQLDSAPPLGCFHQWRLPHGDVWLFVGRDGSAYILRFPGMAEFRIAGDSIVCHAVPDVRADTVRHLFLDQALPLLLSREGKLILHASVVANAATAFAFMGSSGLGKSTLAASFATVGFEILTDDCVVLDTYQNGVFATPVYPSLRLQPETAARLCPEASSTSPMAHYSLKQRLSGDAGIRFRTDAVQLKRVYVLQKGPTACVESLPARESFVEVLKHAFMMDVDDRAALSTEFNAIARATVHTLVRHLVYPHDYGLLPCVHAAIFADLERP